MAGDIERVLGETPLLWRGAGMKGRAAETVASGFDALDALLPGGGWPVGVVVEVCCPRHGIGELQLWLPVMRQLTRAGRLAAWIAPPCLPHALALARAGVALDRICLLESLEREVDRLWSAERLLRLPAVGLVLLWLPRISAKALRRLQLAVAASGGLAVLFVERFQAASPAPLRLRLMAEARGLRIDLIKLRGGPGGRSLRLALFDEAEG